MFVTVCKRSAAYGVHDLYYAEPCKGGIMDNRLNALYC